MASPRTASFRFYGTARKLGRLAWINTAATASSSRRRSLNINLNARVQRNPWDPYRVSSRYVHVHDPQERRRLVLNTIDKGGFGWWVVFVAGIGFFTDAYDIFAINMILPMIGGVYYGATSIPKGISTSMKTATLIGSMIGMLSFGWLADVYGRRKMYGLELIITIAGTMGVAMCSNGVQGSMSLLAWMIFWRLLMGIGIGADYPLSAVICAEFAPTKHRARMMCLLFFMQAMGQLSGILVTVAAITSFKKYISSPTSTPIAACDHDAVECIRSLDILWRLVVGIGAVPAFVALFFRRTIPESPRYTLDVDRDFTQAGEDVMDYFGEEFGDVEQPPGLIQRPNTSRALAFQEGENTLNTDMQNERIECWMDMQHVQQGQSSQTQLQVSGEGAAMSNANAENMRIPITAATEGPSSSSLQASIKRGKGASMESLTPSNPTPPTSSIAIAGSKEGDIQQNLTKDNTTDFPDAGDYGSERQSQLRSPRAPLVEPVAEQHAALEEQIRVRSTDMSVDMPTTAGRGPAHPDLPIQNCVAIDSFPQLPVPPESTTIESGTTNTYPYSATWADARRYFITLGKWRYLMGTSLTWFVLDFAFYGLGLNSPDIVTKLWDIQPDSDTSLYDRFFDMSVRSLIVVSVGAVIGGLVMIKIVDHWGTKKTQFWGFIILGAFFFIIGTVYEPLVASPFHGVIITLYVLCQVFFNLGPNTTTFILPAELFPTRYRSTCHGIAAASGKLGSIVAQIFFAQVNYGSDKKSKWLGHVLQVIAGFMFLGAALTKWWIPETMDLATFSGGGGNENKEASKRNRESQKWRLKTLEELGGEPEYSPEYRNPTRQTATPRPDSMQLNHAIRRTSTRRGTHNGNLHLGGEQDIGHGPARRGSGASLSENRSVGSL